MPARWALAIISIICFWPLGIAACVFAARVKPALDAGDVTRAMEASSRVRLFFWISLGVFILVLLYALGSSGSSTTS